MVDATSGNRRFVVTGGAGFLGTAVSHALARAGCDVTALDARAPRVPKGDVGWQRGSVLDAAALRDAFRGVDAVIHLAGRAAFTRGEGFRALRELHVGGTVHVVEAARHAGVRRVVLGSTALAFARSVTPRRFDVAEACARADLDDVPYLLTAREAEEAGLDRGLALDVDVCALRPGLVLGPTPTALAGAGHILLQQWAALPPNACTGRITIVDVRDLAPAFVAAAREPELPARVYYLGGADVAVRELAARAIDANDASRSASPIKALWARAHHRLRGSVDPVARDLAAGHFSFDAARARSDLRFSPRPLQDTLRDTFSRRSLLDLEPDRMGAP